MGATAREYDLTALATRLQRLRIVQSMLYFTAAYMGLKVLTYVSVAMLAVGWLLLSPARGTEVPPRAVMMAMLVGLGAVVLLAVALAVAAGLAYFAGRLTLPRTQDVAILAVLHVAWTLLAVGGCAAMLAYHWPLVALTLPALAVMALGWLGIAAAFRVPSTPVGPAQEPASGSIRTVADVIARPSALRSAIPLAARWRYVRRIAGTLTRHALALVALAFVSGGVAALFPRGGWAYGAVLLAHLGILCLVSSRISRKVQEARRAVAPDPTRALQLAGAGPVLVLRSFRHEATLTQGGSVGLLSASRRDALPPEEHMTDHLWQFGPVVGLGRPGEPEPPPGIARYYLHTATDPEWQAAVKRLAGGASVIVAIAADTAGLAWEMGHLAETGLRSRLLIIIPPWLTQAEWERFCGHSHLPELATMPLGERRHRLVGVRLSPQGPVLFRGPSGITAYEALALTAPAQVINDAGEMPVIRALPGAGPTAGALPPATLPPSAIKLRGGAWAAVIGAATVWFLFGVLRLIGSAAILSDPPMRASDPLIKKIMLHPMSNLLFIAASVVLMTCSVLAILKRRGALQLGTMICSALTVLALLATVSGLQHDDMTPAEAAIVVFVHILTVALGVLALWLFVPVLPARPPAAALKASLSAAAPKRRPAPPPPPRVDA